MLRTIGDEAAVEDRPMPRTDLAVGLGLAVATVLSRIPFRAHLLPTWDAVQFALALDRYDIAAHQPHPPGYILYVAAAHAIRLAIGDATQSLVWLSIAASGAAVFLVHRLAWRLYGPLAALAAALGFATSPLFWFYGEVGLPYAVEAALASAVAVLTWSARSGRTADAVRSAVALGLAGGVRQSLLPILFPMWAATAWSGARRIGPLVAGVAAMGAVTVLWLAPMLELAGGIGPYLGASRELYDSTVRPTTVLAPTGAWIWNALALGEAALLGLGLLLPVLAWAVARAVRRGRSPRESFLAIWILPPLGVYTWLHFGQYGYLLAVLPALYVLIGGALAEALVAPRASRRFRVLATAAAAGVLIAHVAFATGAPSIHVPDVPVGAPWTVRHAIGLEARYRYRLWPHTLRGLREGEEVIKSYAAAVRRDFSPADTVIVSELGNPRSYPWFRHLTYYLPEFRVCHLRLPPWSTGYLDSADLASMSARPEERIPIDPRVRHLVWVVDSWSPLVERPDGLRELPVPYGRKLYVLDLDGHPVDHAGYRFAIDPERRREVARGHGRAGAPAQAGTDRRGVR